MLNPNAIPNGSITKEKIDASVLATKQDTINDLDTIRSNAAKGATALQSESDPIYTADKPNLALKSELDSKVDKEEGKGLSSNDYTDEEKTKLTELEQKFNSDGKLKSDNYEGVTSHTLPNLISGEYTNEVINASGQIVPSNVSVLYKESYEAKKVIHFTDLTNPVLHILQYLQQMGD